jgi:hypothetical protein
MSQRIRKIGGLLSLVVLLGLLAADTMSTGITLQPDDKFLLVSLVSALLGIDILHKRTDAITAAVTAGLEELSQSNNGGSDDDDGG